MADEGVKAMKITGTGHTDKGRLRPHNEDALLVLPEAGVFAVADGMGGHAAGEVASRLAIEAVSEILSNDREGSVPELLQQAMEQANRKISSVIERCPEFRGMGTTIVVAVTRGSQLWIGHLGDSRAYLVRDGALTQLTADHSLVNELVRLGMLSREEAAQDSRRNVVTRALGSGSAVTPDVIDETIRGDDMILLCSDGLNTMLEDAAILEIAQDNAEDLAEVCRHLIAAANDAGGEDNITVVAFRAAQVSHSQAQAAAPEEVETQTAGGEQDELEME